jgi:tRNA pseudouridine38-40 synthase
MRTIRLTVEYDGTHFAGWQRQADGRSVQAELERAIEALTQTAARVVGAGRTDAGVHALGQVAHFLTESRLPLERIAGGLNALLPRDVSIRAAAAAPAGFHARRSARFRLYRYLILRRPEPSALLRSYALHVRDPLDLDAMRAALGRLEGEHDFRAFRALGTATRTTRCILALAEMEEARDDLVVLTFGADRFLRHMVRMIVGTILRVGKGTLDAAAVGAFLTSDSDGAAGPSAPAHGLYLIHVGY